MVSIVIPIYNGKEYIKQAILSAKAQTYSNLEIIVIDDGSTDGIDEKYIADIDKSVIFHTKDNEGLGETRNLGIELANGDYIFFLDADDTLPRRAIELLRNSIDKNDFSIGRCKRVYLDKNANIYKEQIWKKDLYKRDKNKYNLIVDTIATNKLYKKSFLLQNGIKFLKGLYEDKLFVLKLFENTDNFNFINEIVYYWHVYYNSSSISNAITIPKLVEKMSVNRECIAYTKDEKLRCVLVDNIIKHDFKVSINEVNSYTEEDIEKLYYIYREFICSYDKYINHNNYFVDRIIVDNIENKDLTIREFKSISRENSTRNICIKIKKYMRYSYYFLRIKLL